MRPTFARLATALAVMAAACSGGEPTKPVETQSPAPTVRITNLASTLTQTPATYPSATGTFSVSASAGTTLQCYMDPARTLIPCGSFSALPGDHRIYAVATGSNGKSATDSATVVVVPAAFKGKVYLMGTTTCPSGVKIKAGPGGEDFTSLASDCTYSLESRYALSDTARITADPTTASKGFLGRVPSRLYGALNIVLLTPDIVIPEGIYKGQKVPIDLEKAFAPSGSNGDNMSFFSNSLDGNGVWGYMVGSYPTYPVPVAICRSKSDDPAAPDSTLVSKVIDRFNQYYGSFYVMADAKNVCDDVTGYGVRLLASSSYPVSANAGKYSARDFLHGKFNVGKWKDFSNEPVALHELTHAQGLGHTDAWASIMSVARPGTAVPSLEDVAYTHYMITLVKTERVLNTRLSLPQAHQWDRVSKGQSEQPVNVNDPVAP
ncbi:MAG: hypothetical protein V4465_01760 [Patescibacteria group bacterium]